jgi:hypothetical protein
MFVILERYNTDTVLQVHTSFRISGKGQHNLRYPFLIVEEMLLTGEVLRGLKSITDIGVMLQHRPLLDSPPKITNH